jgi:hypothetical protein
MRWLATVGFVGRGRLDFVQRFVQRADASPVFCFTPFGIDLPFGDRQIQSPTHGEVTGLTVQNRTRADSIWHFKFSN